MSSGARAASDAARPMRSRTERRACAMLTAGSLARFRERHAGLAHREAIAGRRAQRALDACRRLRSENHTVQALGPRRRQAQRDAIAFDAPAHALLAERTA